MGTYIALIDYTDHGVREIADSPARSEAFIEQAASMGVTVKDQYWTFGGHDGVVIVEAPDDQTAEALFFSLGAAGSVRTQTLRAYDRAGMAAILSKMAASDGS